MAIGCFLPAAEPRGYTLIVRNNTLMQGGDGYFLLAFAAGASLLAYRRWNGTGTSYIPIVLLGILAAGTAIVAGNNLTLENLAGETSRADRGIGLVVVLLGGLAMAAGGIALRGSREAAEANPEGWYEPSDEPGTLRWWDGHRWTGATRPVEPQPTSTDRSA